jgi:hypothetical protein
MSDSPNSAARCATSLLALAAWSALVAIAVPAYSADASRELRHVALVIGNSAYHGLPNLPECTVAARGMSAALRNVGFDVIERLDATNGEIGGGLAALAHRLGDGADASTADGAAQQTSAVIYACGYASGFDGRAFLLPVSVRTERPADLLTQGVLAKSLVAAPAAGGARNSLVLLDVVRLPGDGPLPELSQLEREASGATRGLIAAGSDAPAVNSVANAAAPTRLAAATAAALAEGPAEAGAIVGSVRRMLEQSGGTMLAVAAPQTPAWLGEPPRGAVPQVVEQTDRPPDAATDDTPPPSIRSVSMPESAAPTAPGFPAPDSPGPMSSAAAVSPGPAPAVAVIAPDRPATAQLPDERMQTDKDRRLIQAALARLGYYAGPPDGVYGPETRAAMRRFQHEIGAEQTGRLTGEQATKLIAGAG